MGRWEPDARGRLERAAMELYCERGFEQTTVAEIARRAGLTERTFFRHFADKREVLFSGTNALEELMVGAVAATPPQAPPIEAVAAALDAVGEVFAGRRERSRVRQSVIRSHAELRERELIKLARLSDALAAAFGARGMGEPAASLTAEAIIAVFRVGFVRWVETEDDSELGDHLRESLAELREVTRECR